MTTAEAVGSQPPAADEEIHRTRTHEVDSGLFGDPSIRLRVSKVLVAMSGGVDSSVAAALLVRAGHDVVGCFMRLGSPGEELPATLVAT